MSAVVIKRHFVIPYVIRVATSSVNNHLLSFANDSTALGTDTDTLSYRFLDMMIGASTEAQPGGIASSQLSCKRETNLALGHFP